jgi:D-xylulose 5-phosphate/D-fructose 6-phosphate phosphoketolase
VNHRRPRRIAIVQDSAVVRTLLAHDGRLFCPDERNSNRLGDVVEVENRYFVGRALPIDDHVAPDGRVMEVWWVRDKTIPRVRCGDSGMEVVAVGGIEPPTRGL